MVEISAKGGHPADVDFTEGDLVESKGKYVSGRNGELQV